MKYFTSLLLLPGVIFAGNIGKNYLGAGLGFIKAGIEVNSVDYDFDGFAFGLGANFNAIPLEASYGVDISIAVLQGNDLEGNSNVKNNIDSKAEFDVSSFSALLRPHTKFGDNIVFVDIGYSYSKSELDQTSGKTSDSDSAFAIGLGAELEFNNLCFTPSLLWIFNEDEAADEIDLSEALGLTLPIDYNYSENVDISFSYSHIFYESFKVGASTVEPSADAVTLGLKYKF